jgi:hypothetical protein
MPLTYRLLYEEVDEGITGLISTINSESSGIHIQEYLPGIFSIE